MLVLIVEKGVNSQSLPRGIIHLWKECKRTNKQTKNQLYATTKADNQTNTKLFHSNKLGIHYASNSVHFLSFHCVQLIIWREKPLSSNYESKFNYILSSVRVYGFFGKISLLVNIPNFSTYYLVKILRWITVFIAILSNAIRFKSIFNSINFQFMKIYCSIFFPIDPIIVNDKIWFIFLQHDMIVKIIIM